jgi:hypothetical protein
MSDGCVFQGKHSQESAVYVCKVVAEGWSPNDDVQQVMSAFCTMAWALDQLPKDSEVRHRLAIKCTDIGCWLLDKKQRRLSNQIKRSDRGCN